MSRKNKQEIINQFSMQLQCQFFDNQLQKLLMDAFNYI